MTTRFLCVHGHFYQPPRDNPWLEAIEVQDSAAPFHDWNARIQAECYAPNGACRIREDYAGPVVSIVNNYAGISFNFGPTLLSWMEEADPKSYARILKADRESAERRGGHGNALAQAYNHIIMPLASDHDRRTQVLWGVADFTHRFSRPPEGMWLPETGVDRATLKDLAEAGVKYTVLAPGQAAAVRKRSKTRRGKWTDVHGARVDPTKTYRYELGGGKGIDLFFYDGPISGAVAFEGLLADGRLLAERLLGAVRNHEEPQLVHIATDGETYGHHHKFGDMALAAALQTIEQRPGVQLTNYGEYLERFPPEWEVKLNEPSAWSCAHGVGRWSRDCGCNAGTPGYNQAWRAPLRAALDYLKDGLDELFVDRAKKLLKSPWGARDEYIWVLLNRKSQFREEFLAQHGKARLKAGNLPEVWRLLEMQRMGMLQYTSCGWFFDEVSGIEGVQILRYAARAIQLAESLGGDFREGFLKLLAQTPSNVPDLGDARVVFERHVMPSQVDPDRILARHAIAASLDPPAERSDMFCYRLEQADFHRETFGTSSVAVGRLKVLSEPTQEVDWAAFAVLHFGEHDFSCKVHRFDAIRDYDEAKKGVLDAFRRHSLKDTILAIEEGFPGSDHDIRDLFAEERRSVLRRVLAGSLEALADSYARIYRENSKLMGFLAEVGIPMPEELAVAGRFVLARRLEEASSRLRSGVGAAALSPVLQDVEEILTQVKNLGLEVSRTPLELAVQHRLEREAHDLADGTEFGNVEISLWLVELVRTWRLEVALWKVENDVFRFLSGPVRRLEDRVRLGETGLRARVDAARELARALGFAA